MARARKHRLVLSVFSVAFLSALACCSDSGTPPSLSPAGGSGEKAGEASAAPEQDFGKIQAVLNTTQGKILIEFFPEKAPEHVRNFVTHARNGYYDKTYFHRVFPNFMIQGGCPLTKDSDPANDGNGGFSYKGPGTNLRAEFNDTKHVRGVVSMARMDDPNSAGSQFFIMVADAIHLDGKYTAFGRVVEGMDAVDRIVRQPGNPIPQVGGVNPLEHQYIESIEIIPKD